MNHEDERIIEYIERAKVITQKCFPWYAEDGQSDNLIMKTADLLQKEYQWRQNNMNDYYDAVDRHNKSLVRKQP